MEAKDYLNSLVYSELQRVEEVLESLIKRHAESQPIDLDLGVLKIYLTRLKVHTLDLIKVMSTVIGQYEELEREENPFIVNAGDINIDLIDLNETKDKNKNVR